MYFHYSIAHCAKSSTGEGSRPSSHFTQFAGVKFAALDSITQERNSSPPFIYGGGETGLKIAGNGSSTESDLVHDQVPARDAMRMDEIDLT